MGLPALEFSDCYIDSPQFRERLKSHELELDKTNKFIKELIKDGKALVQSLNNMSSAKRKFAESLNEFKFQCIGDAETDDEICIARSLQEFAGVLKNLEDERTRMIENASDVLITPLERFRKEQIGAAKEARKKYDKETEKYCSVLEKHLNLSSKKKESHLLEADTQVDHVRQHFYEVSLEYVFKVQEVQERKMFEFVEPLLAFLQGLFTFYHHGYELAKDFSHFKTELTISIQNTRNRFEGTRSEVECLMKKMKENPDEHKTISPHTMQGYLFVQEKRSFVSTWVKHYCTYQREPKRVTIVLFDQKSGGKVGEEETFILKSCTRRKSDSIEKRFCFDVEAVDRPGVITMQALSEEDRRLWMEAMDGREPVYNLNRDYQSEGTAQLDSIGFNIIKKFIHAVETRGINEQGLYRIAGVGSRVQKLLGLLMDSKTSPEVDVDSAAEWEIKTVTSALKHYLRMLPGPLMTYQFQRSFIKAASKSCGEAAELKLALRSYRTDEKELCVANNHQENLMTVANLGVVFGPTLLRPQEETVAAIMDIKFQNIVIEILIENHEKIFNSVPESAAVQPNSQLNSRRRSAECKPPSCSERPLTLFHTTPTTDKPQHSGRLELSMPVKRNMALNCLSLPALYLITPERPTPEWEEPERPTPEWEEPERPTPEWEEPERPTPEWEEPERPTPEWEEPERPTPVWEEPERPTPAWGEPERPQPKRGESVRPQPKEGGVGASIAQEGEGGACRALGPKLPAEGECLLVPPLLLPPQEPEGGELQAQPPEIFWGGEGQDAGVPQQPLFLLLKAARRAPVQPPQQREPAPPQPPSEWPASAPSPLPPPQSPAREAEPHQSPAREAEPHQSPASEAELHQSPAKSGDYTLLLPPSSGDYTLLPPPSRAGCWCPPAAPIHAAEGSTARTSPAATAEGASAARSRGAGAASAARTSTTGRTVAGAPKRGAAGHEEGGGGLETTFPSSSFAAGVLVASALQEGATGYEESGGGPETCSHCSSFAAGSTVAEAPQEGAAGSPERGAAGHEEGGRGLETTFPSSSFAAGVPVAGAPQRGAAGYEEGGGRGTTCPRSFFAAGVTVAGAPQRGAAGYEEGGGRGTTCPRSNFAAGVDQHAVGRATTGRGADSMASHGPSEASLTSPRLCPGLLGF
ncbi:UNVERIFIED_CONTAM: hypothetical protein FKN15_044572 [Acipenser sinensis]